MNNANLYSLIVLFQYWSIHKEITIPSYWFLCLVWCFLYTLSPLLHLILKLVHPFFICPLSFCFRSPPLILQLFPLVFLSFHLLLDLVLFFKFNLFFALDMEVLITSEIIRLVNINVLLYELRFLLLRIGIQMFLRSFTCNSFIRLISW